MIGYPPRARCRPASFLFGMLAGAVLAVMTAGIIWLWNGPSPKDPVFEIVAVSWGTVRADDQPYYQAVVKARDLRNSDGYEISAQIALMSPGYHLTVGVLGIVKTRKEAIEKFGIIRWTSDEVTFGSETAVAASVKRSELESHR